LGPQDLPRCFRQELKITASRTDHVRWKCARCEVSVGRIDGEPSQLPENWARSAGDTLCLGCRRERVGEVALDTADHTDTAVSRQERVNIRRRALIEFEIGRMPEAPNRTIAQACHTSPPAVAAIREAMTPQPTPAN
jgi:hypothetical protein